MTLSWMFAYLNLDKPVDEYGSSAGVDAAGSCQIADGHHTLVFCALCITEITMLLTSFVISHK